MTTGTLADGAPDWRVSSEGSQQNPEQKPELRSQELDGRK